MNKMDVATYIYRDSRIFFISCQQGTVLEKNWARHFCCLPIIIFSALPCCRKKVQGGHTGFRATNRCLNNAMESLLRMYIGERNFHVGSFFVPDWLFQWQLTTILFIIAGNACKKISSFISFLIILVMCDAKVTISSDETATLNSSSD